MMSFNNHSHDVTETAALEARILYERIPPTAKSFIATVADPTGWDALPCMMFSSLNFGFFPSGVVGVSRVGSDSKAVMHRILPLMMLAVGHGVRVEFRCDADPKTFETLRRCVCLLFRQSDLPGYTKTYDECFEVLRAFRSKGSGKLLEELTRLVQLGNRSPLLRPETAIADSPPGSALATAHPSSR
jgi:hypothetical protein